LDAPAAASPSFLGTRAFRTYDLPICADHIDWTPFFQTWELNRPLPAILEDESSRRGGARRSGTMRRRC
jgi:5-methyltetrahydrofolate--homocysteine methyltransferase